MSLKIAIVGHGKMGQAIEEIALERGHSISHRIDRSDARTIRVLNPGNTDIAIEFTQPDAAISNFTDLMDGQIPVVTGTTGWYEQLDEVREIVRKKNASLLWSSNFSVGVNILFLLNQKLASLMNPYPEYDVLVEEKHHRFKQDAPSGTAVSLSNQILEGLDRKQLIVTGELAHRAPKPEELSVASSRAGGIIGEHTVLYTSEVDEISISHKAYTRKGFALGAVLAAEWLHGKKGFYNFGDIFN